MTEKSRNFHNVTQKSIEFYGTAWSKKKQKKTNLDDVNGVFFTSLTILRSVKAEVFRGLPVFFASSTDPVSLYRAMTFLMVDRGMPNSLAIRLQPQPSSCFLTRSCLISRDVWTLGLPMAKLQSNLRMKFILRQATQMDFMKDMILVVRMIALLGGMVVFANPRLFSSNVIKHSSQVMIIAFTLNFSGNLHPIRNYLCSTIPGNFTLFFIKSSSQ